MDRLPEPLDRGHLLASDADRERVADLLRRSAGDGRLTLAELDERLDLTYAAKTYSQLDALTGDLPRSELTVPASPALSRFPPDRIGGTPGTAFSIAIMSGSKRAGRWVVPHRYTVIAVMGGVELDLRHAVFSEREVTIQIFCLMGGVSIVVDEEIEVDVSGIALMGGFDHRAAGPGVPGAPVVRVSGFALMGGVDVKRRSTGSSSLPQGSDSPQLL